MSEERLDLLRSLSIFAHYGDADLEAVDALLCDRDLAPGAVVMSEGQPGREAFIVVSGTAEIRVGGEVIAYASAGDMVGEMALLDAHPRSATVVALTPMTILVMDPGEFATLLSDPRTAMWIATSLSNRLRDVEHPVVLAQSSNSSRFV